MLYSKALCEYYKLDSDLNLGFIMSCLFNMSSVYLSAYVLIHVNTYKLTIHIYIYGIHNDITKHKQPEATVINVNRI